MINSVRTWMQRTSIPQLFFYTKPAAFFTEERMKNFLAPARNISTHFLGKGAYNHLEDYPVEVGTAFSTWLENIAR